MKLDLPPSLAGERLDKVVGHLTGAGRARTRRLFAGGHVQVLCLDGDYRRARKGDIACLGDTIFVAEAALPVDTAVADANAPLEILLRTPLLVVVNKPAGQPSAPIRPGERGTLANALVAHFPEMATVGYSPREPGLCHRLDNDTSGAVLAARTQAAFDHLRGLLKRGALDKRYLLICGGLGLAAGGTIDLPIAPHPHSARRVVACRTPAEQRRLKPSPACTCFVVLQRHGDRALVEAKAPRALRHQIRAHFSALGHPIAGDTLYGAAALPDIRRHALHASRIAFAGDAVVRAFDVEVPLPQDLQRLLGDA